MQKILCSLDDSLESECFNVNVNFNKYRIFLNKIKIEHISQNILDNYLNNQKDLNSNYHSIPISFIKSFVILLSKSLSINEDLNLIGLKEIQCSLTVLDYLRLLNIERVIINSNKINHLFFLKLDNLLFNEVKTKEFDFKQLTFSDEALTFLDSINKKLENDFNIKSRKNRKNKKNLIDDVQNSIKFLCVLLNNHKRGNIISRNDVYNAINAFYKILFVVPKHYYYTIYDLYRLRFSDIFQKLAKIKKYKDFQVDFRNSELNNFQKLVSKVYPPRELRNIGINNQPLSNFVSHLANIAKLKKDDESKYNYGEIREFMDYLIGKFDFNKLIINSSELKQIHSDSKNDIHQFYKYGFRKKFELPALNLISYFKNFVNNIFENLIGRKEMLFYYSGKPQQIISFIVSLSLIDSYKAGDKRVTIDNICRAIRAYSFLLLDSET
jgi:hypothetical protein